MARVLRKRLDHATHFAGRFGAIYFITICCQKRGSNQLCEETIASVLFNTARIYHERGRWDLDLLLLMPDHLHVLIGIDGRDSLSQLIRDFKRTTAKLSGVEWQRNFFDHCLRHDESLTEKFAYICQNPVRAGLAQSEADWPYRFIPHSQFRR
jgi:REP element-mobilizing transposase RayT